MYSVHVGTYMYQTLQKQSLHRSSVELFGVVDLQFHLEQMFYDFVWGKRERASTRIRSIVSIRRKTLMWSTFLVTGTSVMIN